MHEDPDNKWQREQETWRQQIKELKQRSFKIWLLISVFQGLTHIGHQPRQAIGAFLGWLTPWLIQRRTKIVKRNLELCFPHLSARERHRMMRQHFRVLAHTVVDRSVLWFGSPAQIRDLVHLEGLELLRQAQRDNRRIMMLAPHFVGLDASASRLTLEGPEGATIYAPQSDPEIDALVRLGRGRFHKVHLISRRDGVRGLIRKVLEGIPIYYLPDMDLGRRGAVFSPFFGVEAATQTATAHLAQQFDMCVFPILSYRDPKSGKYVTRVLPALEDIPGTDHDIEAATHRLNAHLQDWIEQAPEQYYWVHRRFKSRPEGQPNLYD